MIPPAKKRLQAANDLPRPPAKPFAASRLIFAAPPGWFTLAAVIALFLTGAFTGGMAVWLSGKNPAMPATPAVMATPQGESPRAASLATLPAADKGNKTDKMAPPPHTNIVLPAESLLTLPGAETRDGNSDGNSGGDTAAINLVAAQIGDLPALGAGRRTVELSTPSATASTAQLRREAQRAAAAGDDAESLALYDQLLALDKTDHDALSGKAFVLAQGGNYRAAIGVSRRLLQLYPDDADARRNLAAALGASQEPDALRELQSLLRADPDNAALHAALAQHFTRTKHYAKALPHLDAAVRAAPDNLRYRLDLAILYDKAGYGAEALTLYRQILVRQQNAEDPAPLALPLPTIRQRIAYLAAQAGDR